MQKDLLVIGGGGVGGEQCSKNSFLFSYMFNTKSSCFSPKIKLYMYENGDQSPVRLRMFAANI